MSGDEFRGRTFGRYRIRFRIARGGMATVYLAEARGPGGFEKHVALKVIHPQYSDNKRFVRMFLDEARLTARLSHPNICAVFDFGENDSFHFLAMEYLDGESMRNVLNKMISGSPIPGEYLVRIVADAARGLHAAHELKDKEGEILGVVHRDVSPQNIYVLYDGVAKVLDFGIARARDRLAETTSGEFKGKLAYMAPEQLDGRVADRRADVFALGVVLWEATTSTRLFQRDSAAETIAAVLSAEVPPPSTTTAHYPEGLEPIVMRALERDRDKRFETMEELADALEDYIHKSRTAAGPAQVSKWMRQAFAQRIEKKEAALRSPKRADESVADIDLTTDSSVAAVVRPKSGFTVALARRRTTVLAAAAVVLIALLAGLGGWYVGHRRSRAAREIVIGPGATHEEPGTPGVTGPAKSPTVPGALGAGDGGLAAPADAGATPDGADVEGQDAASWTITFAEDAAIVSGGDGGTAGSPDPGATDPASRPRWGYLNLMSIPAATVTLRGRRLGTTPLRRVRLEPGRHYLHLKALRGDQTKAVRVTIRAGKVSYITARIEQ